MIGSLKFIIKLLGLILTILILFVLILVLVSTKTAIPPKETSAIRIACTNVNYRNQYLEELCEQLRKLNADILIINEWSGKNPAPDSIAGMVMLFGEVGDKHGTAIFAKEIFRGHVQAELFYTTIQENRDCRDPMAAIRILAEMSPFSILGIHIPPPHLKKCRNFREPSLDEILNFIKDGRAKKSINVIQKGDPLIIMGDFNSLKIESKVREFLENGLIHVISEYVTGYCPTWPGRVPHFKSLYFIPLIPFIRIDHIFASKYLNIKGAGCFKIPGSDHRGLFLDIIYSQR